MSQPFFSVEHVPFKGPESTDPLSFRFYDAGREVLGKSMEEQLKFAICWWHTLCWPGGDPFGGQTFQRDWFAIADPMAAARRKADVGFEMIGALGARFFCFHDRDLAPEGATIAESRNNLNEMADYVARRMDAGGVRLLLGTANLFSHRRYMAGAATNPDPEVFAFAAAQVRDALEVTHRLGGANYVMWGGREGYETLLNTDLKRELDQLGRFVSLVVEHKHKIGFSGPILIEPKPQEPTKHQHDFDVATVYGFLERYDLKDDVKLNIEANHATLAGHSFEHEVALAIALGIFGSMDLNRGDPQSGWDTDQFPNAVSELVIAFHHLFAAGGFTTGGLNFDAKLRRQSLDPDDLLHAHIGGMDVAARALLAVERMLADGALARPLAERYAGWDAPEARAMLTSRSLADIADKALAENLDPQPRSGRQEWLENVVNRYV